MRINSARLRELRAARHWSQEQLANLSGLNLRTIQRLESGARISTESLRALAAVFEVPAESLLMGAAPSKLPALDAMRAGVERGLQFSGTTPRPEFWWFALAVALLLALATLLAEVTGPLPVQVVSLIVLVPWLAACTRRLRDAGLCPWWQVICLVPVVGVLLLLYLLTYQRPAHPPATLAAPAAKTSGWD